jgi:hypothetical protein
MRKKSSCGRGSFLESQMWGARVAALGCDTRAGRVKCCLTSFPQQIRFSITLYNIQKTSICSLVVACANRFDVHRPSATAVQTFSSSWAANTRSIASLEAISRKSYYNILIQCPQSSLISKSKGSRRYPKVLGKDERKVKHISPKPKSPRL